MAVARDLPFNYLYKLFFVNLVYFFILWLNAFTVKNGVSQDFSPRSIVVRKKLSWKNHFRIKFGVYVNVNDEPETRNTLTTCTHPSNAVGNTGDFNDTVKFLFGDHPNTET